MNKTMKSLFVIILIFFLEQNVWSNSDITIARIQYQGGGDWYGNRTTFVNLFQYVRQNTNLKISDKEISLKIMDKELFKYPLVYMAGHGNIRFSEDEVARFRKYLINGGFLWADDDYGMDPAFRREMKKVFPEGEWIELPYSHSIYHTYFQFPNGLPKIHKHDGGPPKGLGFFYDGRMIAFYSLNTDISDGCEDPDIHKDPMDIREQALKMGTNIIIWALTH
jgi:hypothetical protein